MKRRTLFTILSVALFAVICVTACTPDSSTVNADKLIVGTSADYEPFEYIDVDGNYRGFDVELMEEIAKRMDVEIEWQDISFDGLIPALQSEKINVIIAAMSATDDRKEQVDFTSPYFIGSDALIIAEDSPLEIGDKEDLASLSVGVQLGTIQEVWLDENIDVELTRYERADEAILSLQSGRIDVVAMDYYAAVSFLDRGGIKLALKTRLAPEHLSIAVAKGNLVLRDSIDVLIQDLQAEGFIDELALKYLTGGE